MGSTLIFDYDGVIADSLDIFMDCFIKACNEAGFSDIASKQEFLLLFEGNMFEKMMNKGMSKQQILRIMHILKDELLRNQDKVHVFPGMKTTLHKLSMENTLLIITSNESNVVKQFLLSEDLNIFADIYGSEIEPSKVKKIEMIKHRYKKDSLFYIGDTVGDIIEGKQAGVGTIAVSWGWHDVERLQKAFPSHVVSKPEELIALFS